MRLGPAAVPVTLGLMLLACGRAPARPLRMTPPGPGSGSGLGGAAGEDAWPGLRSRRRGEAGAVGRGGGPSRRSRRGGLTAAHRRAEYGNTVTDLLGVGCDPGWPGLRADHAARLPGRRLRQPCGARPASRLFGAIAPVLLRCRPAHRAGLRGSRPQLTRILTCVRPPVPTTRRATRASSATPGLRAWRRPLDDDGGRGPRRARGAQRATLVRPSRNRSSASVEADARVRVLPLPRRARPQRRSDQCPRAHAVRARVSALVHPVEHDARRDDCSSSLRARASSRATTCSRRR